VLTNLSCHSYTEYLLGGFQRALCSTFSVVSIQSHFQRSNARGSKIWRYRQMRRSLEVSVNLFYFPHILTTGNAVTWFQSQKLLFTYPVRQYVQISRTSSSHIKILGARKVTLSKFHTWLPPCKFSRQGHLGPRVCKTLLYVIPTKKNLIIACDYIRRNIFLFCFH